MASQNISESCMAGCIIAQSVSKPVRALISVAVLVIGALGIAGILPRSTVGWAVIGLTLADLGCSVVQGDYGYNQLLGASIFLTLGSLGITGGLSAYQVGWGVVGIFIISIALHTIKCCYYPDKG